MYHTRAWSDVLLMIALGLWVLAKKTIEMKCHSHCHCDLAVGGDLDCRLAVACIFQVSPLQNDCFSPFPYFLE